MRILIDADGCPVVDLILKAVKKNNVEVIIICDTSHEFYREGVQTIVVSKGADSVDFKIVSLIKKDDLVVTQDYGLAAMCLAMGALAMNQNGMRYTNENINDLLLFRHNAREARMVGVHLRKIPKRTKLQDNSFLKSLHNEMKHNGKE